MQNKVIFAKHPFLLIFNIIFIILNIINPLRKK